MTTQRWNNRFSGYPEDNTDGANHVHVNSVPPGGRNPASATNGYQVVRDEANLTIISKTTAATIGGGVANDTHLIGIHITTALTGTCVIAGFLDDAGVAKSLTLPVASVGYKEFKGAINAGGALTVTCSNAADDDLVAVLWKAV